MDAATAEALITAAEEARAAIRRRDDAAGLEAELEAARARGAAMTLDAAVDFAMRL